MAILVLYGLSIVRASVSSSRKVTESAFFVNDRASSAWGIGLSIVVSCVGASATIGMVGLAFNVGTPAFWWLGGGAAGLALLSLVLAKKVRADRAYTMPQLVERFLGAPARPLVSVLIVVAWTAILAAQFVAIAKVLWALTGFPPLLCSCIGFALIAGHTFGGLAAVMRTDKLQAGIMIGALLVLLGWLTGHNPEWIGAVSIEAVNSDFPIERFLYFLIVVGANYLVCPTLFNRFLSAKNTTTAKNGGLFAVGGLLLCAVLIVAVGLACRGLLPAGTKPDDILTTALVQVLPPWLNYVISIALVSTIVSSADSCLITVSTILSHDLLKTTKMRTLRLCVLGFGCLGLGISLWDRAFWNFYSWPMTFMPVG